MASEVDIVNLALSRLGDKATVSSIDPPEGSAQAAHAARFYPIARNSMQEMHPWAFTSRRITLALLAVTPPSEWAYAYAAPSDALNFLAVTAPDAMDDYSAATPVPYTQSGAPYPQLAFGLYTPQPYVLESLPDNSPVIYTNQIDAVLRYTALVVDTTKFSPLYIDALSWLLASHLAGPVLKGDVGRAETKACMSMAMGVLSKATVSDANQRRAVVAHITPWLAGR